MNHAEYMDKASRALSPARLLLADGDVDGACNRAYYAMFATAHAALLGSGMPINPAVTKTHSGLIGAFGRHLVKAGHVSPELGRALNEVEHIRRLADYTGEDISHEKATWAVERAAVFVEAIRATFWSEPRSEG